MHATSSASPPSHETTTDRGEDTRPRWLVRRHAVGPVRETDTGYLPRRVRRTGIGRMTHFGSPDIEGRATTAYAVLGVDPEADTATIRRAYRALARRHHPD